MNPFPSLLIGISFCALTIFATGWLFFWFISDLLSLRRKRAPAPAPPPPPPAPAPAAASSTFTQQMMMAGLIKPKFTSKVDPDHRLPEDKALYEARRDRVLKGLPPTDAITTDSCNAALFKMCQDGGEPLSDLIKKDDTK